MPPNPFDDLANGIMDAATCALGNEVDYFPIKTPTVATRIRGILDVRHQTVDPDTEVVVSATIPSLGVKVSDLPDPPQQGDKLIIIDGIKAGQRYRVIDVQEDGVSGSELFLHEVET